MLLKYARLGKDSSRTDVLWSAIFTYVKKVLTPVLAGCDYFYLLCSQELLGKCSNFLTTYRIKCIGKHLTTGLDSIVQISIKHLRCKSLSGERVDSL